MGYDCNNYSYKTDNKYKYTVKKVPTNCFRNNL